MLFLRISKRELSSIDKGNYLGISYKVSNASVYVAIVVVVYNEDGMGGSSSRDIKYRTPAFRKLETHLLYRIPFLSNVIFFGHLS